MAESKSVWGIEIGQCGLKAIKLRYAEAAHQVVAVGFDYIPHAKILSQPDAIPEELINDAITKFLSRNQLAGDLVAIALPSQSALARFIQLPPVESSKVHEIVKYEARQQIPFPLDDVIWDYQQMGGGMEEGGFMLEAEVGLFAMKREQVLEQLRPFQENKVEVELMQIAPLALYSYLSYDQFNIRVDDEDSTLTEDYGAVIDMGADQSTLMISNGGKIWIRNIPIGGNHFTRALTKEMKLTFAKAEHLKCNATKSPDPKSVFQALKPVFGDYLSEVQRSLGYFSSTNREANITKVVGCGNGFRLAGLQKFLEQNLDYPVERADDFTQLVGSTVVESALFRENILTFTVPYGLALQCLKLTTLKTTLLPPEIARAREIRKKKPWAVVTAATLLTGLTLSAAGYANSWRSVNNEPWNSVLQESEDKQGKWSGYQSGYDGAVSRYSSAQSNGDILIEDVKDTMWLEFYKTINECLPRDVGDDLDIDDIQLKNRVMVHAISLEKNENLQEWFDGIPETKKAKGLLREDDRDNPPQGEGYLVTLQGEHYHHIEDKPETDQGINYLLRTVIKNLESWTVKQPEGPMVPVRQMGFSHAVIIDAPQDLVRIEKKDPTKLQRKSRVNILKNNSPFSREPTFEEPESAPTYDEQGIPLDAQDTADVREINRTQFIIQFAWRPVAPDERLPTDPAAEQSSEGEDGENEEE